jgi:hypothetical protein
LIWRDVATDQWVDGSTSSGEVSIDSAFDTLCPGARPDAAEGIVFRDPRAEFPRELRGAWLFDQNACNEFRRDPRAYEGEGLLLIGETEVKGYEYSERVNLVRRTSPTTWAIDVSWGAEGDSGVTTVNYSLQPNGLFITSDDRTHQWIRCGRASIGSSPSSGIVQAARDQEHLIFEQNRVAGVYRGPIRYPDFRGRDRQHAMFRTRIQEGIRKGPNFAGRLAIIQIGCGTGCLFAPVADVVTGRVFSFPIGGEDYSYLDLQYRLDSRAVIARWQAQDRCFSEAFVWTEISFKRSGRVDLGTGERCHQP